MPSESCGRTFSVAKCLCVLPAGHKSQHRQSEEGRRATRRARDLRFYVKNQSRLVRYQRKRRREIRPSVYQQVIRNIRSVERNWNLRLQGKIKCFGGGIRDKPLEKGEFERVRVELRRIKDRYKNAPATAFLRLPRLEVKT